MKILRTRWGEAVLWEDVLKAFRRANVWRLKPDGVFGIERKGKRWMWRDDFKTLMAYLKKQRVVRLAMRRQREKS